MLTAAFTALILFAAPPAAFVHMEGCHQIDVVTNTCNVDGSIGDGGVILTGDQTTPGTTGSGDAATDGGGSGGTTVTTCVLLKCTTTVRPFDFEITGPAVTMADIAAFRPASDIDHMQPNGWMVVGLSTNFYSIGAGQQVVDGTLLDRPASVRFTPVQWNWDYGDGTSAEHPTPGSAWSSRAAEFTLTSTGHVYQSRGTYTITLTVDYRAQYKFAGGDWVAIPGILTLPTNELTATAGGAKTVLVGADCIANPGGPGC